MLALGCSSLSRHSQKRGYLIYTPTDIDRFLITVLTPSLIEQNTFLNSSGRISKAERKHDVKQGSIFF